MFTRRQLLRASAGVPLAGWVAHTSANPSIPPVESDRNAMFPLGVASADPTPTGIVLWTHVPPERHQVGEMLHLDVATDAEFATIVITQSLSGERWAHRDGCVSVALDSGLQSNRYYWYRFRYAGESSRTGRCRTLPANVNGETPSSESPLRIAVVNCQEFSNGYYGAYHHLANEEGIAFVLHLGDSIYERVAGKAYLQHPHIGRTLTLPSGSEIAMDLKDYRALYRHYRADPDYQQALAMHTFVFQIDDHEIANNNYWDEKQGVMGVSDHPYGDVLRYPDSMARIRQLQRDALQAWSEFMPSRLFSQTPAEASAPVKADQLDERPRLYRRLQVGEVAILLMDSRLYRSKPPCKKTLLPLGCHDYTQEHLTLLGEQQRAWLVAQLEDTQPRWTLLVSQIAMSRIAVGDARNPWGVANTDAWDGYAHERAQLMATLKATQRKRFVVLSGDMHATLAGVLQSGELAPALPDPEQVLGAEFMSPPISSPATVDLLFPRLRSTGIVRKLAADALELLFGWMNPQLRFVSIQLHGYSVIDINADRCRWQAKVVDIDVPSAVSSLRVAADFVYAPTEEGAVLRQYSGS